MTTTDLFERLGETPITRNQGVALYRQIRDTLTALIVSGSIALGEQLPPEDELASMFGVSRMTVRRALEDMANDGIIRRQHGRGTVVVSHKVVRNYNRLTSFYEDAQRFGLSPSSRLLNREVIRASQRISEALTAPKGSPVIHLTRLRYTKRQIVSLNEVYVRESLCPWLMGADLENRSLYQLYESHGLPPLWGYQRIEAIPADEKQAEVLEVEHGWPLLYLERTTFTDEDVPIEWVQAYSPSGLYALEMTLRR